MKFSIQIRRAYLISAVLFAAGLWGALRVSAQTPPTITSFSPTHAAAGASVTITGTNFDGTIGNNQVMIGGVKAAITAASATSLTVTVPLGIIGNGPISVLNKVSHLWAISTQFFYPDFSPNKAALVTADIPLQGRISAAFPTNIYGIEAGDFDGDGKLDIVASNSDNANSSVWVRLNNTTTTNITFGNPLTVTVSGLTNVGKQFAIADFDGDGKEDIAVPGDVSNSVAILRNTSSGIGAISFSSTVESSGLTETQAVAAADFDGDGRIDMATIHSGMSQGVIISTNTSSPGSISFSSTRLEISPIFNPAFLSIADFDGDGKPDIITGNGGGNAIYVLLNTTATAGSVSFSLTSFSNAFSNPGGATVGDIDNDGKPDLIISHGSSSATQFAALRNISSGGSISFSQSIFSVSSEFNSTFSQGELSLADINGDGKPDLVMPLSTGALTPGRLGVFNNTSTSGSINFATPYVSPATGKTNVHGKVLAADFNGDGRPDILETINSAAEIGIFRNTLQFAPTISAFAPLTSAPGNTSITLTGTGFSITPTSNIVHFGAVTATVTGAGSTTSLTVTVPNNAAYAPITVMNSDNLLSGQSRKNFIPAFTPNKTAIAITDFTNQGTFTATTGNLYGLAAADLTKDGNPELIETDDVNGTISIYPNISTSAGTISYGSPTVLTQTGSPRYIAIADLDGNGWLDMVVPSGTLSTVSVYLNPGTGSLSGFTLTGSFTTGETPIGVATGDIDGDGRIDIVTANNRGGTVSVFRNTGVTTGNANFTSKQDFNITGTEANYNMALVDIDGDGKLDIIAGRDINSAAGTIAVLQNTSTIGNISFAAVQHFPSIKAPWTIVPSDIDGDGLMDLVVSSGGAGSNEIAVHRNTSSGGVIGFAKTELTVLSTNRGVAVADLNGDGKPDIVTAPQTATSSVYNLQMFPNASTSGNISFGSRVDMLASTKPYYLVATDMNSDGKPDIIAGNQDIDGTITTYRNTLIATPVTQATNISVTTTGTGATLSWTNGNGAERAVFMLQGSSGTAAPVNNIDYTASTTFGSGTQIGSTGWYCVYNGTGSIVTVAGLTPATNYRAMVIEYNDGGLTGTAQYNTLTATGNPANLTTRATLTAISRTTASATINTSTATFSVTFNATVTGLSTSNFSLTTSGITGAAVTAISGSGSSFSVTVSTGSGDGTITLRMVNATGVSPLLTNTLPFTGEMYTIDKTAPTLSPVTIVSNNGNTAKAKTGNIITLAFSSSETISTPAVTLSGNTVTVTNTGANNWSASYTMTGSDAEGTVAFNIGFSDLVGNTGTAVTSTTNSSSVVFDRTAPTLPSVTISSSNSNASLAFTGDIITLNFTAGETIATPVVTIAGATATVTNTGGNNWKATYTITGAEAGGIIPFNIAFSDITGNAGTAVTATTNSSSVIHDKTAPTLSIVTIASSNSNAALAFTGDIITVNFTSSEAILTPAVTIAGGTATVTNTGANNWKATYTITGSEAGGTIAFNISFSDLNSNAGTAVTATTNSSSVTHDKTAPTLTLVSIASNNTNPAKAKTGNTVTLSFTSSEAIQTPTVTIAGGIATITNTSSNNWTATYSMSNNDTEGTIAFTIGFSDLNNNAGTTVNATTNSSAVVFDKTNPLLSSTTITTSNPNNNRLSKTGDLVTVGITANEPIIPVSATIAGHAVSVTNSSGNTWTASYTMTSADTEGTIDFNINYTDFSGNTGSPAVTPSNGIRAIFDKTNPTLPGVTIASLSTPDAGRARPNDFVRISITGSEDLLAPTVTIAGNTIIASQNGGATTWSASYRMTNTDPEGLIAFSVAFSDATGNSGTTVTSTTNNSSVVFDRTAPLVTSLTIVSNNANPARAKVGDKITATMIVNESILTPTIVIAGQSTTPVYNGNNTWAATYTMTSTDGTQTVGVQTSFRDLSSNTGSSSTTTDNSSVIFDKTAPALTAVTILSTGPSYTAIPGDKITIDFASSETISAPVVSIAGHLVTAANTSGNSWKATYTMTNTDATGIVPFSIAFSDLSGNAGTVVTATTNNSSVLFSIPGSGPPFTNGTSQTMSMCQDAPAVDINSMMSVNAAAGTTLTWSVTKQPSLGKLTGFNATMISSGGTAVPSGMSYTPTAKFYGTDAFIVQVSDGVNTATTTVNVTINQLPALAITGSPILCEGLTTTLSANANNASSFIWLRNGVQISNVSGATLTVSDLGTYTAYAVSAAGCQSVISNGVTMLFYAKPKLSVSSVDVSCINIPVTFTSTSTVSTVTLALTSWNDGNGGVSVSGNAATFTYTQPGTYNVKFKVTPSSCRTLADSVIKPITIEAIPKAAFSAAAISCVNLPVLFTNQSTVSNSATVTYNWSDNNGHTSTSTSPTFTYSQAGSFAMKLKVTPQACPANADSIVQTISIVTATSGVRLATANVITGKLSQLEARNQTGASYNWTPNTGLISVSIYNPQILTTKQEQYLIVMTLPGGCTTTDTLLVRVQAPSATVLVPNVFTPNGDGQNDKLTPTLVASIKTLSFFRVFNRWGKMLYETKQIGQGWDGKYNGILQPLDTYTWVIEGFDTNDQKVKKQGSVTLLR